MRHTAQDSTGEEKVFWRVFKFCGTFIQARVILREKIVWLDETKIDLYECQNAHNVWSWKFTAYLIKKRKKKFGGENIMVWDCLGAYSIPRPFSYEGRLGGQMNREILSPT